MLFCSLGGKALPSVEGFGGFLPQIWALQAIKGGVAIFHTGHAQAIVVSCPASLSHMILVPYVRDVF